MVFSTVCVANSGRWYAGGVVLVRYIMVEVFDLLAVHCGVVQCGWLVVVRVVW